jgi:hypothetical protein
MPRVAIGVSRLRSREDLTDEEIGMSNDDSSRIRKATLPLVSGGSGAITVDGATRPRRSTLETFNDEMAVLDRPLEGDVEYVDEPRKSRLRPIGFAAVVVIVGVGGALFMSRHRAAEQVEAKVTEAAPAPAPTPAPAPAEASPVMLATQTPAAAPAPAAPVPTEAAAPEAAAAAEPEGDDAEADESAASQESAPRMRASKGAWAKVRSKAAPAKPARATSGKSSTTRRTTTTTRHTVVAKRVVTRHR